MDELGERDAFLGESDAFVLRGMRVDLQKGLRYRIFWKDDSIYEGTYRGYFEKSPWCHTVAIRNVIQITANRGIHSYDEDALIALEKQGIMRVEKVEHDLAAMLKIIEPDSPDYNFSERTN
jgi:hypothetical protein